MGPNVNDLRAQLMSISRETQKQYDIAVLILSTLGLYFAPVAARFWAISICLVILSYFLNGRLIIALLDFTEADPEKQKYYRILAHILETSINSIGISTTLVFIAGILITVGII